MPDQSKNPFNFWQELKRRKVVRVITVYAAAAFVILELASIVIEPLRLPEWTLQLVIVLLSIGFIISIILSWVYDITPEGVQKTEPISKAIEPSKETPSRIKGWKIATFISVLIIIGLLIINIFGNRNPGKDISELEKSIAVLHFENLSNDEGQAWFSDGITDIIINQLSKITEYRVLGRTSTLKYRKGEKSISEIGEELGVNFIIEGTVQRVDEHVRISVQLLRVNNENHLWSDLYDRKWNNIFDIQNDIAINVARELRTALSLNEIEQIEKTPTESSIAYDLYLQGRHYWNLRTREGMKKSMDFFTQAIEIDKDYALAYSGLADVYYASATWYFIDPDSAIRIAKLLALKSLFLDNKIAQPYATLAGIASGYEHDYELADLYYKQSLLVNPNYSSANQWYAMFLTQTGQSEKAIEYMSLALKSDPLSAIINFSAGMMYYSSEDYEKALFQFEKTIRIDPTFPATGFHMIKCYLQRGQYKEAFSLYAEYYIDDSSVNAYRQKADRIYSIEGNDGLINCLIDLSLDRSNLNIMLLPILYTHIGNKDKALDLLEFSVKERTADYMFINVEPAYKDLHSEPRFKAILEMIGR